MYFWPFVLDTDERSPVEGFDGRSFVEIVILDDGPDVLDVGFY